MADSTKSQNSIIADRSRLLLPLLGLFPQQHGRMVGQAHRAQEPESLLQGFPGEMPYQSSIKAEKSERRELKSTESCSLQQHPALKIAFSMLSGCSALSFWDLCNFSLQNPAQGPS